MPESTPSWPIFLPLGPRACVVPAYVTHPGTDVCQHGHPGGLPVAASALETVSLPALHTFLLDLVS